jgi:hypothetical protein
MSTTQILIEIDPARLSGYSDSHLATLWHVAQANPADGFEDQEPGELAERIGREIIRRWLGAAAPELYHHQGGHYHWRQLTKFARWDGTAWVPKAPGSVAPSGGVGDDANGLVR